MGLFDMLKRDLLNAAKKGVSQILEKGAAELTGQNTATYTSEPAPAGAPAKDTYSYRGSVEDYFAAIFHDSFPQYSIQRNVRYAANPNAIPVTFLVTSNAQPVLAVIVCDKHRHGRRVLRDTIEACNDKGISVQCYYSQFRNDANYVIDRLGSVLR